MGVRQLVVVVTIMTKIITTTVALVVAVVGGDGGDYHDADGRYFRQLPNWLTSGADEVA
jgi:hypothetical protein